MRWKGEEKSADARRDCMLLPADSPLCQLNSVARLVVGDEGLGVGSTKMKHKVRNYEMNRMQNI